VGTWRGVHSRDSGGFSRAAARLHHHSNHGVSPGREEAVRRVRKISNAHIFEPTVARDVARHRLLDEILSFFGGRAQPMMAQLAEAGKLTQDDLRELEKIIERVEFERKAERTRKSK
jgi:Penicillinase repressor